MYTVHPQSCSCHSCEMDAWNSVIPGTVDESSDDLPLTLEICTCPQICSREQSANPQENAKLMKLNAFNLSVHLNHAECLRTKKSRHYCMLAMRDTLCASGGSYYWIEGNAIILKILLDLKHCPVVTGWWQGFVYAHMQTGNYSIGALPDLPAAFGPSIPAEGVQGFLVVRI